MDVSGTSPGNPCRSPPVCGVCVCVCVPACLNLRCTLHKHSCKHRQLLTRYWWHEERYRFHHFCSAAKQQAKHTLLHDLHDFDIDNDTARAKLQNQPDSGIGSTTAPVRNNAKKRTPLKPEARGSAEETQMTRQESTKHRSKIVPK